MIGKKLNYKTELILYKDKRAKLFILEIEVKAFKIKIYPCLKKSDYFSLFPSVKIQYLHSILDIFYGPQMVSASKSTTSKHNKYDLEQLIIY